MRTKLLMLILATAAAFGQKPAVSMMPNLLATDAPTVDNFLMRFDQTVAAGSNYLVGNATWAEIEPQRGVYNLDGLRYLAYTAAQKGMRVSFTLRIIDGNHRATPTYLNGLPWNDTTMRRSLKSALQAISGVLGSRAEWYILGYEINPYFELHPGEVSAFATLYRDAKASLKRQYPTTQVSTSLIFYSLSELNGVLAPLQPDLDFLALNYLPIQDGWRVRGPMSVTDDIRTMRQVAGSRKILLLEAAYPSSTVVGSSLSDQALFYRNLFSEIQKDPQAFAAVACMLLGDFSDADAANWAYSFGISDSNFRALFQTLGVWDAYGVAKPAWQEFVAGAASLR